MTKAEMLRFLEPFANDVVIRMWNGTVWAPAEAKAEYSGRSGRTTIYLEFNKVKPKGAIGMTTRTQHACLHCWHSDPDTSKETRWYCCACPEETYQIRFDIKWCAFCHWNTTIVGARHCNECVEAMYSALMTVPASDLDLEMAALVIELRELLNRSYVYHSITVKHSEWLRPRRLQSVNPYKIKTKIADE